MRVRPGALAACLALLLASCQTTPLVPMPPGDPRPQALLTRWSEQRVGRDALRATARLAVDAEPRGRDGEPLRVRSKQRVVLARPARLRVEVEGLLGTTLAVLAVDDRDYAFFEAETRRFETGPVHPSLLWDVVRLDLTPGEAVGVILGAPSVPEASRILAAWDLGRGLTRIALGVPGGSPRQVIDLDADARLRRFEQWGTGDAALWHAEFDAYAPVLGVSLAHRVTIETRSGTHAVLSLAGVELNPSLAPDIFRLDAIAAQVGAAGEGG